MPYKYFKTLIKVDTDELDIECFGGDDATDDDVDEACMEAIALETCGIDDNHALEVLDTVPALKAELLTQDGIVLAFDPVYTGHGPAPGESGNP